MRRDAWTGTLLRWSCQPLAAHSCDLLNHLNSFPTGMFKLNAKFYADLFLYSLSHLECDSHTVYMLTRQCLPPPRTSTVKSSLFMHVHSSPLSLEARLHWCQANCSHCINNGWMARPFLDTHVYAYMHAHICILYTHACVYAYVCDGGGQILTYRHNFFKGRLK